MKAIKGEQAKTLEDLLCKVLKNQTLILDKVSNFNRIHSFSICVDNKSWTKSLVFNSKGLYITTYWLNELGVLSNTPNANLISDCGCNGSSNDTPVIIEDTFESLLEIVQKYNS